LNAPRGTGRTEGERAANNLIGCHDSGYCSSKRSGLGRPRERKGGRFRFMITQKAMRSLLCEACASIRRA
jgi:hypothetical protein